MARLKSLPDPYGIMEDKRQGGKECAEMLAYLLSVSKAPDATFVELYNLERGEVKTTGTGKVTDLLHLLTKMAYRVEDLKEPRGFVSELDNGQERNDWLYPLRLRDGVFRLATVQPRGDHTGLAQPATDERDYVASQVRRRG